MAPVAWGGIFRLENTQGGYKEEGLEPEGLAVRADAAKLIAITMLYLVVQLAALHWVAGRLFTLP